MIAPFFALSEPPFANNSYRRRLYISSTYQKTLVQLVSGIEAKKGVCTVIGEPGVGKTALVHTLVEYLSSTAATALILHPPSRCSDVLRDILQDFGLTVVSASIDRYLRQLRTFLCEQHAQHATTALVIDEAQQLSGEVLDLIRRLSALEIAGTPLLQIVLVGEPVFQRSLRGAPLQPLRRRIAIRCTLNPLSLGETRSYIAHRMTQAGGDMDAVFDPGSLKTVHRWSRGIPSRINTFCDQALLTAYAAQRRPIDREIVRRVAWDLRTQTRSGIGAAKRWLAVVVLLGLAVASTAARVQESNIHLEQAGRRDLRSSLQRLQQTLRARVNTLLTPSLFDRSPMQPRGEVPVNGALASSADGDGMLNDRSSPLDPTRPIVGSRHDDRLQGSSGDDTLWAYAGKDYLIGGLGNDQLYGGGGDDVYEFAPGFGRDEISHDTEGMDTIVFAAGIAPEQVVVIRDGSQLILRIVESVDQITVKGHYATSRDGQIERVRFANGTVWALDNG